MTDRDHQLDDRLREVPLPSDLHAIVGRDRLFDEAAIDRLLGQVAVPAGLADRVRACVERGTPARGVVDLSRFSADRAGGEPTAAGIMQAGPKSSEQTTVVAAGIFPAHPWRRRLNRTLKVVREAGTVAAALALTLLVAVVGIEVSRQLEGPMVPRDAATAQLAAGTSSVLSAKRQRATPAAKPEPARESPQDLAGLPPAPADENGDHRMASTAKSRDAVEPGLSSDSGRRGREPAEEAAIVRGAPIVAPTWRRPPTMSLVTLPQAARRVLPRSAAFDFAFEMAHGEAPFVDPAADPDLAVDRPPLTLATDGFHDLLRNGIGRRPRGDQPIRVEEVLAAMPPPPMLVNEAEGPVRLGLQTVPSGRRIGGMPTLLMEAAVYAAGEPAPTAEPRDLTLVIDQSMAGDSRVWSRLCRGVAAVASRLDPAARLAVVLCGPRPRVAIQDATPADIIAASTAWERLPAAASADLDAGLELAEANALFAGRTIVVGHAVTLDRGRATTARALTEWHRSLAAAGGDTVACAPAAGSPRFVIIDPAAPGPGGSIEPTFGRTGPDETSIRRELLRQATGGSSLVASQCRLEIRFDPASVARYRIVGHRQSAIESLAADLPSGIDLHAGDTVRAVYEIIPRTTGAAELATAVLTWRSPDREQRRLEVADRGRHGRPTGDGLSAHDRSLLLATWLGELAGGSVHHSDGRSLIEMLGGVAEAWRSEGDLPPFGAALVELIDRRRESRRPR